jgi:hypothetical protein
MYETLCADFVRHNPSFDEDGPVNEPIHPNNLARMRYIDEHPALPGQVDSLYKEHLPVSGNGNAPAALNSNGEGQQLVPAAVGARSMPAAGPSEIQRLRAEVRQLNVRDQQHQIQIHHHERVISVLLDNGARQANRLAAIEELLLPTTSALPSTLASSQDHGFNFPQIVPRRRSMIHAGQEILVAQPQPLSFSTAKAMSSSFSDVETVYSSANSSREARALQCPSLTSDTTAATQHFGVPMNVPRYGLLGSADPNDSIKEREQTFQLAWGSFSQDDSFTPEETFVPEPVLIANERPTQEQEPVCPTCGEKMRQIGDLCVTCFPQLPSLEGT